MSVLWRHVVIVMSVQKRTKQDSLKLGASHTFVILSVKDECVMVDNVAD